MEEYKEITHIIVYIITQSITFFPLFTLSKIILIKVSKLRNFVLSFIMLLNLGAEGCIWQYFGIGIYMCVSDQQKMDS